MANGNGKVLYPTQTEASQLFRDDSGGLTTGDLLTDVRTDQAVDGDAHLTQAPSRLSSTDLGLCAKKAAVVIQEVALANSTSLVDRGILEDIVADNKARFAGCITMPITFIFFSLYIAAATLHEDITNVHLLESPLRQSLVPPLDGLLTNQDVWHYVSGTLLPVLFQQKNMYDEPLSDWKDWSRVYSYNQLKGPVVLEQVRSIAQPCDDDLANHMVCYPQDKYSQAPFGRNLSELSGVNMSVLSYPMEGFEIEPDKGRRLSEDSSEGFSGRRLRVMREELARWMPQPNAKAEYQFKIFLYPTSPIKEIEQRIDYFKQRGWLDDASSRVTIKALVLNPEIEPPRIENVKWHFAMSRGGGVFATMRFETLFLRGWNSGISVVVDCLFVMMLLLQTTFAVVMTVDSCRRRRCRQFFKRVVNLLAWVNIIFAWLNVLLFFSQDSYRKAVIDKLDKYREMTNKPNVSASEQRDVSADLHNAADQMASFTMWYRLLITYMNLLLMVRCFLVLEFQPRLAVVIATLKATSIDLAHFLIVFVPTFLAYAIAGMCIFGRRVEEFSSLERSVGTCFKIAMESEYEWDKLSEEDFITSASWVWTFLLLIVLLMLNMVLAIIMDVYTEVRNAAGNSETVAENIKFVGKRLYYWRDWISDDKLLEVLSTMPRALTGKEFREAFPGMTDVQYKRLMGTAVSKAQTAMRTGLHNTFLAHMTSAIKVGLDRASKALQNIKKQQESLQVKGGRRPDGLCIEDIMQSLAVQNHWMTSVQTQLDTLRVQTRTKGAENHEDRMSQREFD